MAAKHPPQLDPTGGIAGHLIRQAQGRLGKTATVGNKLCRFEQLKFGALIDQINQAAHGLLDLGCAHGSRVGLIAENSDLWLISDLALLSLGAVDIPRGGDAAASEVQFCLSHAQAEAAIVETASHVEKLGDLRAHLKWVVVMRGEAPEGTISFDALLERGARHQIEQPKAVEDMRQHVKPTDLATIIYTSGTTGNPKGVMLTHDNMGHNIMAVPHVLTLKEGERFLSFLPSWHSFERILEYIVIDHGLEIHYSSKRTLRDDFKKVKPHFVAGVPRVWETFYNSLQNQLGKLNGMSAFLVKGALAGSSHRTQAARALSVGELTASGALKRPNLVQKLGHAICGAIMTPPQWIADRLVYRKLRDTLGGNVRFAISGGGPLPAHVDEFLTRAGIPLLNGYGLTESSPVICVRDKKQNLLGTIGKALPATELRIVGEDGKVLPAEQKGIIQARGPQIMQGYFANQEATAKALTPDGWLDTGDIGVLTQEGDLAITGRAKDTIVLRGGENVEPEPIETDLCSSPLIAEVLLVGHGQKTLGALVCPDRDYFCESLSLPKSITDSELAQHAEVESAVRAEIARIIAPKRGYRGFERVGKVAILEEPFSVEAGTLTATMKKRRPIIEAHLHDLIAGLFSEATS